MPLLRYTLLRLAVLVLACGLTWLLGLRGWLWIVAAVLIAGAVSYLVLPRQRVAAVTALENRAATRKRAQRRDEDADAEDAAIDGTEG
ncbi:DUF4229 domain-containing protein [Serinibacter salmoneus]|uniref:DUF4229 domain-containing protein n=1 Tax=Serinibacter salmoneus TaxID=556530 RepID=UPI001FE91911|nr:DUF4229 domain-containing protein [Serinibacter salmoneus]